MILTRSLARAARFGLRGHPLESSTCGILCCRQRSWRICAGGRGPRSRGSATRLILTTLVLFGDILCHKLQILILVRARSPSTSCALFALGTYPTRKSVHGINLIVHAHMSLRSMRTFVPLHATSIIHRFALRRADTAASLTRRGTRNRTIVHDSAPPPAMRSTRAAGWSFLCAPWSDLRFIRFALLPLAYVVHGSRARVRMHTLRALLYSDARFDPRARGAWSDARFDGAKCNAPRSRPTPDTSLLSNYIVRRAHPIYLSHQPSPPTP
ncbi:hypothetical protein C8J57DRAFT_1720553 [Mycena rebaudengoi]|nr:hypothetical protein C8J57DRAFT_1720553 [Mycena rebaudengoi]